VSTDRNAIGVAGEGVYISKKKNGLDYARLTLRIGYYQLGEWS